MTLTAPSDDLVSLESVLCTEDLKRRPSRPPDYQAENQALRALALGLTSSSQDVLQTLVDLALELCHCDSAGISLLEEAGSPGRLSAAGTVLRWHAVAGRWAPLAWNTTTPRDDGPCGTVLDRDCTLLFRNAHRYFTQFAEVHPLLVEGLLVPFHVGGKAVGTVWAVAHDEGRQFDAEDQRLLESLALFAATAYQARVSVAGQEKTNRNLRAEVVDRQSAEHALQEADRRKSEFLAMLAHELRNPLAPIRNAVEILKRSGGDGLKPITDMMQRQVGQMVRLIDDLLDVSRITRGKIALRRSPLDLALIIDHALEAFRPLCEAMGHTLTVTLPPKPMYVDGDFTRLAQVVGNLLNNACKFTPRGGRIGLIVEGEGREAIIRVQDTGIGLTAEQLPSVFDLFAQVDSRQEGLGIGLTLVKTLVELHGGTITARSSGVDQGSEFVVRLPALSEPPTPREPPAVKPVATTQRRVLVVDDNKDAADSLAMILKLNGHEVHTAHDGVEAVAAAGKFQPDLILLDIGLPRLDGYDAARQIREQQREKAVTLVALTGWGQEEDRRRSKEAGFDAHMVKPVDFAALSSLLAELDAG